MKRSQLRADFEKSFINLDHTKSVRDNGGWSYARTATYYAWLGWLSAFETYSTERLAGEYDDPS